MDVMKDDIDIIKELPSNLRSIDIEAIGSLVCVIVLIYSLVV